MTRIFDRIFRYRQSDGRTPWEDYFTEILAAILEKHEKLAAEFVEYLADRDDIRCVDIQTQRRFGDTGRRPDIYMTAHDDAGERHVLIVENKIGAPEGENQLADYMKLLEKEQGANSRTLVYITQYSGSDLDRESNQFKHLYWYQVYDWIKEWMEKSDNQEANDRELVTELLNLMEDWKMDGEITAKDLRAAVIYHTSLHCGQSLIDIMDQAWEQSGISENFGETSGQWAYKYYKGWQRSSTLDRFGVRIGMGYLFDRKDSEWDAVRLELPSAAVVIYQRVDPPSERLRCPSDKWTNDLERSMGDDPTLWMRMLNDTPCYGTSLSDFYREFFLDAFRELREALDGT